MKKVRLMLLILIAIILSSCHSYKYIGSVAILSNKQKTEIENNGKYKELKRNAGGNLLLNGKLAHCYSIGQAIDTLINSVLGGKYATNVSIYKVGWKRYAVTGNVWGIGNAVDTTDERYGFKLGALIKYRSHRLCTVVDVSDKGMCVMKSVASNRVFKKPYYKISKPAYKISKQNHRKINRHENN